VHIPEEFVERLQQTFGEKYRIRWSNARQEYHIEQKVRRGIADGFVDLNPRHLERKRQKWDDLVRAKDGYVLTMAVTPGTKTFCPECRTEMQVPAFKTKVLVCEFCRSKGRYSQKVAGYYPLSDTLIDHLRKIDVHSGGNARVNEAVNRHNEFLLYDNKMAFRRRVEAATRDRFNKLVGIPQFGYAGSPYRWDKE
jgi:hypothetical protein